jgi:peptidoglycan/LPS O-acetylase OafA/YrhL
MMKESSRLAHIDGLRGLAVFMVLAVHSVAYDNATYPHHGASVFRTIVTIIVLQGFQGVSLFLVVSGFCLSLPAFRRKVAGRDDWFSVSTFMQRRCWRILPPYYAALLLFLCVPFPSPLAAPAQGLPDVAAHVLLIHNFTPYVATVNPAFWSLALEWQWYIAFPFVLYGMLRWPRSVLFGCFLCAIGWHVLAHDAGFLFHQISGELPARIFEFACGVGVARLVAAGWRPPRFFAVILTAAMVAPIFIWLIPSVRALEMRVIGPPQPLLGISFSALLLLVCYSRGPRWLFSRRPIAGLGIISYSVYLVHEPILNWLEFQSWLPTHDWLGVMSLAVAGAIAAGGIFYVLIERHFLALPRFNAEPWTWWRSRGQESVEAQTQSIHP